FSPTPIPLPRLASVTLQRAVMSAGASDQGVTFAHRLNISLGVRARHELCRFLPNSVAKNLPLVVARMPCVPSAHQLYRLPAQLVFCELAIRMFLVVGHALPAKLLDCPAQPG